MAFPNAPTIGTQYTAVNGTIYEYTSPGIWSVATITLTAQLALKANLVSPDFTGSPTTTTPASNDASTRIANTTWVNDRITSILGVAPAALDTLAELATALGNDANFAATVTSNLALKANIASPTFTGIASAPTAAAGTNTTQLATTEFVTTAIGSKFPANATGFLKNDGTGTLSWATPSAFTASATAPVTANPGDVWYCTADETAYLRIRDSAATETWIDFTTSSSNRPDLVIYSSGTTAPTSPSAGQLWYNTDTALLSAYIGGTFKDVGRIRLTADTRIYVRTTGSDTTGIGTSASPFATIQNAMDYIYRYFDLNGHNVAVDVGAGTFSGVALFGVPVGYSRLSTLSIEGTGATTVIDTTASSSTAVSAQYGAVLTVTGLKLKSGSHGIYSSFGAVIVISTNMFFDTAVYNQICANDGGIILLRSSYTIVGGASAHIATGNGKIIQISSAPITVTLTSVLNFNYFIYMGVSACTYAPSLVFSGTATGKKFTCDANSVLFTNGAGVNYFPGSIAGTTSTGGQYI